MTIDFAAFGLVFVSAAVAAVVVVALFALGIRLLATPPAGAVGSGERDDEMDVVRSTRPTGATVGAVVMFAVVGLLVLGGVWLVVPFFHS